MNSMNLKNKFKFYEHKKNRKLYEKYEENQKYQIVQKRTFKIDQIKSEFISNIKYTYLKVQIHQLMIWYVLIDVLLDKIV